MNAIRKDMNKYGLNFIGLIRGFFTGHAFYALFAYRVGNWLYRHHIKGLPDITKHICLAHFGCEISPYATLRGVIFHHTPGIVIGHQVVMGENCEVFQNVTIGSNRKEVDGRFMPIIGDNVTIGAGAVVVGAITIGNNVQIGANSYVDRDVPDNVLVAGSPARIIRHFEPQI